MILLKIFAHLNKNSHARLQCFNCFFNNVFIFTECLKNEKRYGGTYITDQCLVFEIERLSSIHFLVDCFISSEKLFASKENLMLVFPNKRGKNNNLKYTLNLQFEVSVCGN